MARDDDDDDDGLPPLGENTDRFLDQAKKGQARNFLLVCKGNKVKYLAVRKKPIKKNELNEAKKAGYKGEGYFGVITGKGMELVFNLSMADGYTSEPVKDKILKDFLEEKAEFKCKPTIAIVAELPAIPFDEDDLKNPLIARFLALGEQISQVLDKSPDAEGELTKTTTEIRVLLQDGEFNSAEPRVSALESRLKEWLSGVVGKPAEAASPTSGSAPSSVASSAPQVDNAALKAKLQEALNKLVPQLKQAVVTYPDKKVELLTPVAQIKKDLDAGELQQAKQGILAVGMRLKTLMAQNSGQSSSESKPQGTTPTVGQGVVAAAVTRLELRQVRLAAVQGVGQLEKALRETNDAIAINIADIVSQLAKKLPTELEAILERFDEAVKTQDTNSIVALKGEIRTAAKAWLQFMEQNASHIAGCESNPWNIPVRIVQPIRNSLTAILKVAA